MKFLKTKQPKRSLRAIDNGTIYDVSGNLRRLARQIDRGEHGKVTDAVLVLRSQNGTKDFPEIDSRHWGTSALGEIHRIVAVAKGRLER